jgi:hypothetical protein
MESETVKDSEYKLATDDAGGETPDVSHIGNPDVQHEKNDVNIFAIARFVAGLSIATLAVFALMLGMLKAMTVIAEYNDAPVSPMARTAEERLPQGGIRLQGAQGHAFSKEDVTRDPKIQEQILDKELDFKLDRPQMEWEIYSKYKLKETHSYGTDSRTPGEVRIPVDRAKELLLERNAFASRPQPQTPATSETESARLMEGYDTSPTQQSAARRAERRLQ